MVLEDVPTLKLVVLGAKAASQKSTTGPSQEERALRSIEDKIMMFWSLSLSLLSVRVCLSDSVWGG